MEANVTHEAFGFAGDTAQVWGRRGSFVFQLFSKFLHPSAWLRRSVLNSMRFPAYDPSFR